MLLLRNKIGSSSGYKCISKHPTSSSDTPEDINPQTTEWVFDTDTIVEEEVLEADSEHLAGACSTCSKPGAFPT